MLRLLCVLVIYGEEAWDVYWRIWRPRSHDTNLGVEGVAFKKSYISQSPTRQPKTKPRRVGVVARSWRPTHLMELRRTFDLRVEEFMKMKALFEEIRADEKMVILLARYGTSQPAAMMAGSAVLGLSLRLTQGSLGRCGCWCTVETQLVKHRKEDSGCRDYIALLSLLIRTSHIVIEIKADLSSSQIIEILFSELTHRDSPDIQSLILRRTSVLIFWSRQ